MATESIVSSLPQEFAIYGPGWMVVAHQTSLLDFRDMEHNQLSGMHVATSRLNRVDLFSDSNHLWGLPGPCKNGTIFLALSDWGNNQLLGDVVFTACHKVAFDQTDLA